MKILKVVEDIFPTKRDPEAVCKTCPHWSGFVDARKGIWFDSSYYPWPDRYTRYWRPDAPAEGECRLGPPLRETRVESGGIFGEREEVIEVYPKTRDDEFCAHHPAHRDTLVKIVKRKLRPRSKELREQDRIDREFKREMLSGKIDAIATEVETLKSSMLELVDLVRVRDVDEIETAGDDTAQ